MKVRATAEVVRIEERRVLVKVEAFDERDQIASGTIERYILDSVARFIGKVAAKAKSEPHEKRPG